MVKYSYDAWGNHKVLDGNGNENTSSSFIGNIHPFRYKDYYYNKESNMYYCKSRYYVLEWCRWLNGDVSSLNPSSINGLNLFAYCKNNPVMLVDENGNMPIWAKVLVGIAVIAGLAVASAFTAGTAAVIVSGTLTGAIISGALGVASGITLDENGWSFDCDKAATGFMCGTITGAISGAVSAGIGDKLTIAGRAFEADSYVIRGIKASEDGILAMSSYMAQSAINGNPITALGSLVALGSGLFNFIDPVGKMADAVWIPTMGALAGWVCDRIMYAFEKRPLQMLTNF